MNNDKLDPVDEFERTVAAALQRLRGLAPAAIEIGVGCRDARGRCRILASHDADENADRGSGVAPCQRANFNKRLCHARFPDWPARRARLTLRQQAQWRDSARQNGKQSSENPFVRRRASDAG